MFLRLGEKKKRGISHQGSDSTGVAQAHCSGDLLPSCWSARGTGQSCGDSFSNCSEFSFMQIEIKATGGHVTKVIAKRLVPNDINR